MIDFTKKNAKLEYSFLWHKKAHVFKAEMKPLTAGQFLDFAVRYPIAFGWLTGQTPYLEMQRVENGKVIKDMSNAEGLIDLALSTVVNPTIDDEPYKGNLKDLPDLLVALIVNDFKLLNFLSNGDADFFAEIKNTTSKLSQSQNE